MLSPKQARRMAAKERRVLRRAVRIIVGQIKIGAFVVMPPWPPTETRRERGGVIIYTWHPPFGYGVATTLRVSPGRLGRRYDLGKKAQVVPDWDAFVRAMRIGVEVVAEAARGAAEVMRSFSYTTDPRGAEAFEERRRQMEAAGKLRPGTAVITVDAP